VRLAAHAESGSKSRLPVPNPKPFLVGWLNLMVVKDVRARNPDTPFGVSSREKVSEIL
jgi:hypothetical protein